ncbi:MAG: hypothetical protein ACQESX_10415 [Bacteroidota bacterium]
MKRAILIVLMTVMVHFSFAQEMLKVDTKPESESESESEKTTRDILAIGYQIGGYSLVGFNYEMRATDLIGVHFGAGAMGFTGGIKIHTNSSVNSPFFNISFKDGGFGKISTAGVEFGGRGSFKPGGRFGIFFQMGVAAILSIEDDFENEFFGDEDTPPGILSFGVGLSWSSKK